MKRLIATTAVALVLAAPAIAQDRQPQRDQQQDRRMETQPRTPGPEQYQRQRSTAEQETPQTDARLLSSRQMLRKTVLSQDGQTVGQVDYIAVNPQSGDIVALLVRGDGQTRQSQGQGQSQGDQRQGEAELIPVPWHAVQVDLGRQGDVTVRMDMEAIRQVPTVTERTIAQATSPRMMSRLIEYYAPAGRMPNQKQAGGSDQVMLVGRQIVGLLAPPEVATTRQMRGLTIRTAEGRSAGEVGMVLLNADQGRVEYLMLARRAQANGGQGQQAGQGRQTRELLPVAFQDVELAPDGRSFTLRPDAQISGLEEAEIGLAGEDRQGRPGTRGDRQRSGQGMMGGGMPGDGMMGEGMMGQGMTGQGGMMQGQGQMTDEMRQRMREMHGSATPGQMEAMRERMAGGMMGEPGGPPDAQLGDGDMDRLQALDERAQELTRQYRDRMRQIQTQRESILDGAGLAASDQGGGQ